MTSTGGFVGVLAFSVLWSKDKSCSKKYFMQCMRIANLCIPGWYFLCAAFYFILVVLSQLATFFADTFFRLSLFLIFSFLIKELHLQNSLVRFCLW